MRLTTPVLCGIVLTVAAVANGQVPAGGEFQVNEITLGPQQGALVAMRPDGEFVVVWDHRDPQSFYDVRGRRFARTGAAQGGEFLVNTYTTSSQSVSGVAVDRRGRLVTVWSSYLQDGGRYGVFGQRHDAVGERLGAEFRVNTHTTDTQSFASVAAAPGGGFVAAWSSRYQGGDVENVFAQRYDSGGMPRGAEFRVNSYGTSLQTTPDVAVAEDGRFIVVWASLGQDGDNWGIFGQRYDPSGNPSGAEFRVNLATAGFQSHPAVAAAANGAFIVVWRVLDADALGLFARRFDADGAPLGNEFAVNTYTTGFQISGPAGVASDAAGNVVVAWASAPGDGSGSGIFARRFDVAGAVRGAEFQVNTYTTGYQLVAAVGSDPAGNFVVTWASAGQDGSDQGVFAQRFGGLLPAALELDTAANGILEPGESVDVRPSWRNVTGVGQTFSSSAVALTGPAGAVYTITDNAAAYGTVANGATQECTDCLGVSVSVPTSRPLLHWDATLEEKIGPDVQGQDKLWVLHIGRSFTDVPATSAYYRFVETILHNGVTGGCTTDGYCPSGSTAREQMAVFVLAAKEGSGYAPPACTTPVFADVPAASLYCRWIEELARRGVVSGCGGGNYCPGDPVSREQMAVFVLRTLDPALDPPACTTPIFSDVPASSPFCRWIEELARRGVVTGCGGGNYCPADPVTREQVAVFISGGFGLSLYGP